MNVVQVQEKIQQPRPYDGDRDQNAICDVGAVELGNFVFSNSFET